MISLYIRHLWSRRLSLKFLARTTRANLRTWQVISKELCERDNSGGEGGSIYRRNEFVVIPSIIVIVHWGLHNKIIKYSNDHTKDARLSSYWTKCLEPIKEWWRNYERRKCQKFTATNDAIKYYLFAIVGRSIRRKFLFLWFLLPLPLLM